MIGHKLIQDQHVKSFSGLTDCGNNLFNHENVPVEWDLSSTYLPPTGVLRQILPTSGRERSELFHLNGEQRVKFSIVFFLTTSQASSRGQNSPLRDTVSEISFLDQRRHHHIDICDEPSPASCIGAFYSSGPANG